MNVYQCFIQHANRTSKELTLALMALTMGDESGWSCGEEFAELSWAAVLSIPLEPSDISEKRPSL